MIFTVDELKASWCWKGRDHNVFYSSGQKGANLRDSGQIYTTSGLSKQRIEILKIHRKILSRKNGN